MNIRLNSVHIFVLFAETLIKLAKNMINLLMIVSVVLRLKMQWSCCTEPKFRKQTLLSL